MPAANVRSADFNYITGFEQQDILKIHWYESRPKGQIERKAMNKVENKSGLKEAAILFEGWQEGIIWSCLQGIMGEICVEEGENPESAAAHLGDFCFLAGEPDRMGASAASLRRGTGPHPGCGPTPGSGLRGPGPRARRRPFSTGPHHQTGGIQGQSRPGRRPAPQ